MDVMEPAKFRICWIPILCIKSVGFEFGFGFVPQSWPSHFVQAKGQNTAYALVALCLNPR